ncbi:MAG: PfkB family carbohydrate kinase [Gaiellaceae bacterium]
MSVLTILPPEACRYDLVALGEVMLRFDPGDGRIATTRTFAVSGGGGEYNVARGLRRCFGLRTAIVTALVDNPVGRLLEDLILQGGVDQAYVAWLEDDGVGRRVRNGLNFVERGFGVRAALGCSDRGHSAASAMQPGDVDWDAIFGRDGVRWFHCGGIFAALEPGTAALAAEAMATARRHGTIVSFDLNYRPSLWKSRGGPEAAAAANRELVEHVDVLLGNEEDFSAALGFTLDGVDESHTDLDVAAYEQLHRDVLGGYPDLSVVATSLREARTATVNDWSAVCTTRDGFFVGPAMRGLEIFDRVGGGDSFASGLIYGLLGGGDVETSIAYGVAHGALAMTTPGDTSMATLAEVERVMRGGAARVVR